MITTRYRFPCGVLITGFLATVGLAAVAPVPDPPGRPKVRVSFQTHTGRSRSLAFSSDGKKLLSLGTDGTAKLWEVATGKHVATFKGQGRRPTGEGGVISSVSLGPDGKMIASAELDRSIRLWDVASGNKIATLEQPTNGVPSLLLFSPDGRSLLSLGRRNYLWDVEKRKEQVILERLSDESRINYFTAAAFDSKGKPLVAVRDRPGSPPSFELWTTGAGKQPAVTYKVSTHKSPFDGATRIAFGPDCKRIASAHGDATVRLWDAATGENTTTFPKLPGPPLSLAYSHDGKILAVGYAHPRRPETPPTEPVLTSVRLFDVSTAKVLATLTGEPESGNLVVFSPDGRTLATAGSGTKITLWSLPRRYSGSE